MEINTTVLALVLTFIPGIVCYGLIASLASARTRDNTTIFLQIFMYGVAAYMILEGLAYVFPGFMAEAGIKPDTIPLLKPQNIETAGINPAVVAAAALVGFFQGIIISVGINRSLFMRICRAAGITNRFSDPNVWSFLMNSRDTNNWVTIRHKERGHIYQGYVSSFSAGDDARELVLTKVEVFDFTTFEVVGTIEILYISFKVDDLVLEFGARQRRQPRQGSDRLKALDRL
jgi:hypothetical protein